MSRPIVMILPLVALLPIAPAQAEQPRAEEPQISYPVPAFSRWTRWHLPTDSLFDRDRMWPRSDLMQLVGASPDYAWLLQSRTEPPETDRRLRGYECADPVVLLDPVPAAGQAQTGTITTVCSAPLAPADDLKAAVSAVSAERIDAAASALGIRTPGDLLAAVRALDRRARGIPLSTSEASLLSGLSSNVGEYIDAIYAAESALLTWIDEHPGEVPDISDDAWPPLPGDDEPAIEE